MLKEKKRYVKGNEIPKWTRIIEDKINNIRRKISYTSVILEAQEKCKELTKHQLTIKMKLKRWYGNTKRQSLLSHLSKLKHQLKVTSESLKNRKRVAERNSINKKFQENQKMFFEVGKEKNLK